MKKILLIAEKNDFPLVVIKIYEILKENIKCIDIFLSNNTLKDKENKLFIFIDDFMSKSDNSELKRYKNELLNRIDKLADIDIEKLLNISLKWMNNEQLKIIDKIAMKDGKKLNYYIYSRYQSYFWNLYLKIFVSIYPKFYLFLPCINLEHLNIVLALYRYKLQPLIYYILGIFLEYHCLHKLNLLLLSE